MKLEPINELSTQLGLLVNVAIRADVCKDVGITIEEIASLTHKKVYILGSIAFSYIDTQFMPIGLHSQDHGICMFTAKTFPTMIQLADLVVGLTKKLNELPEIDDFENDIANANRTKAYHAAVVRDVREKRDALEQSLHEYYVCLSALADMGYSNVVAMHIPSYASGEVALGRNPARDLLQ